MKLLNEELVMTQEEKELLLKDLCARLPYGVKCIVTKSRTEQGQKGDVGKIIYICLEGVECIGNEPFFSEFGNFKPYLRSMSSMTEEQKAELKQEHIKDEKLYVECLTMAAKGDSSMRGKVILHYAMDWCNKNHFDYRGLIEKGLAIDATGLNIY